MDEIELQGRFSWGSFRFCDYREVNVYLRGLLTVAVSIREVEFAQMGRVNILIVCFVLREKVGGYVKVLTRLT